MKAPELRDVDFDKIRTLVHNLCGIDLHEGKRELVKARLGKRLRQGNFRSFAEYYRYVTTEEGADELISMIDSISTNLTSFFREDSHFQKLRMILPALLKMEDQNSRMPRLRIWCAGCSTGEEAYSIAMTLKETLGEKPADVKIWATDISTKVLKTAAAGIFPAEKVKKIPVDMIRKYFAVGQGSWTGYYRVKNFLRNSIEFARFNLMDPPPPGDSFDIIFCRNVMIYFNKMTQGILVGRFYSRLKPGGYLFIGHSESLTGLVHKFKYIEPSVYRR
ncbi:MAG: protein-glutamate O-methyltransferase CheR [Syntrophales bacterium]